MLPYHGRHRQVNKLPVLQPPLLQNGHINLLPPAELPAKRVGNQARTARSTAGNVFISSHKEQRN